MQHFTATNSTARIKNLEEYIRGLEAEIRRLGGDPDLLEFSDGRLVVDSFGRKFEPKVTPSRG